MPTKQHDDSATKSNWHDIKKKVLSHWNKLNESEVEQTRGNEGSLRKLVQSKYGTNSDFDKEYERICKPFEKQTRNQLYGGKTPVERDLQKQTAADGFNEPDDEDEEGMTRFDDMNADYTGLAMSEAEQEELLKPDLKGMDASEAQTTPETEKQLKQKPKHNNTAPDDLKPNQDPRSEKKEDITLGRSNSSANTTSSSALFSSGANKKL